MKPKLALFVSAVTSYGLADEAINAIHHPNTSLTVYCLSAVTTLAGAVYLAIWLRYLHLSHYRQRWPVVVIATVALGAIALLALGYFDRRQGFIVYFLPVIPALFLKRKTIPTQ
jgi:uncharacterized membrane protein